VSCATGYCDNGLCAACTASSQCAPGACVNGACEAPSTASCLIADGTYTASNVTCSGQPSSGFSDTAGWTIVVDDGGVWGQFEINLSNLGGASCDDYGQNVPNSCQTVPLADGGSFVEYINPPSTSICTASCPAFVQTACGEAGQTTNAYWILDQVSDTQFIFTSIGNGPIQTCTGSSQSNPLQVTYTLQ
jgi:hypothetical protein